MRSHQKDGEDASNILGDKLHQKMDSIVFTQERIKRQIEDLQERVSGAPTDISDLRDRIEDVERDAVKVIFRVLLKEQELLCRSNDGYPYS